MANDFSFKGGCQPAYPSQPRNGHEDFTPPVWGLSKREYFAAHALTGILANTVLTDPNNYGPAMADQLAEQAVLVADSLIKKLG